MYNINNKNDGSAGSERERVNPMRAKESGTPHCHQTFSTKINKEKAMYKSDLESLKKETEVFRFGASTKGGQRANRKETGIRLRHIPSGVEVKVIEERFQARNLEIAFKRLQERIRRLNRPKKKRIPTRISLGAKLRRLKEKKEHSEKKSLRRKSKFGI